MGQDGNGWARQAQLDHGKEQQRAHDAPMVRNGLGALGPELDRKPDGWVSTPQGPFPTAPVRPDTDAAVLVRLAALAKEKENLIAYLGFRVADEDWHGVINAAGDLRCIEAEMRGLER